MNITTSRLENLIYEELDAILEPLPEVIIPGVNSRAERFIRKKIERFYDWMQEQSIDDIFAAAPRKNQRKVVKAFFKHIGYKLPEHKKQVTKATQQGGRWDMVPTGEWKTVKANIDEFVNFYSGKSDSIYVGAPSHERFYAFFLKSIFSPLKDQKLNESIMLMGEDMLDFLENQEEGLNIYNIGKALYKVPNKPTFTTLYTEFDVYAKQMRVEYERFERLDKAWQIKQQILFGKTLVIDPAKLSNISDTKIHSYLQDINKLMTSYTKLIKYRNKILHVNEVAFLTAKTLAGNLAAKETAQRKLDDLAGRTAVEKRTKQEKELNEFIKYEIEHVLLFIIPFRGIGLDDPDYWTVLFGLMDSAGLLAARSAAYAAEGGLSVKIISGLKMWTHSMLAFYFWTKWAEYFAIGLVKAGDYLIYKPPSDYTEGELVVPRPRRRKGRRGMGGPSYRPPMPGDRGAVSPHVGKALKNLPRLRVKLGKGVQKALRSARFDKE